MEGQTGGTENLAELKLPKLLYKFRSFINPIVDSFFSFGLSVPQDHLNQIRKTRTPSGNFEKDINKIRTESLFDEMI